MPSLVHYRTAPVIESLAEYDTSQGEEIFLSYTHGREYGPGIERNGKGPPIMDELTPGVIPGTKTTHPVGQRLRTWLIGEDLRPGDLEDVYTELVAPPKALPGTYPAWKLDPTSSLMTALSQAIDDLRANPGAAPQVLIPLRAAADQAARAAIQQALAQGLPPESRRILDAFVTENPTISAHDSQFVTTYGHYEVVGQQGCGDLTMNLWSVAYLNSPLSWNGRRRLIFLHAEPVAIRTYPCLVKWKPGNTFHKPPLTIEDLKFDPNAARVDGVPNNIVWAFVNAQPTPVADAIEFAVSGKPVIRNGAVVNLGRRTRQFTDLRHLIKMPNLNPVGPIPQSPGDSGRPRPFFGRPQRDDVWFGEAQLRDDENLQRLAMGGPVILSCLYEGLGVSKEHLVAALDANGYVRALNPIVDLIEGQYRFDPVDDTLVEIFFKKAIYAWTVIGLDATGTKIQAFAGLVDFAGGYGQELGRLAANLAGMFGTRDALLFDEGQDVFQKVLVEGAPPPDFSQSKAAGKIGSAKIFSDPHLKPPLINPDLDITVPLKRKRLRACFIFARPRQQPAPAQPKSRKKR
jgi:hypothetical protein